MLAGVVVVKVKAGSRLLDEFSRGVTNSLTRAGVNSVRPLMPRNRALERSGGDLLRVLMDHLYLVSIGPSEDPLRAAAAIARHPGVEYAEPKYLQRLEASPNDPTLASQSNAFTRMQLFDAWSIANGLAPGCHRRHRRGHVLATRRPGWEHLGQYFGRRERERSI